MKYIVLVLATTFSSLLFGSADLSAKGNRYQVYFVSVGSGWYATSTSKDVHDFSRIFGATQSATIVADTLTAGGAQYGIKLISENGNFVTVADIQKAVQTVASKMASQKPSNPLFVFYLASHGMSEGIGWSHFSIPGDFGYRGDPDNLNTDGLSKATLYAGDLVDQLEKFHVPFLVLLDSCYDGHEKHFEPVVLSAEASRNLNDVATVLRAVNEFHDTYPVLFSATPGQSVSTVKNPLSPGSVVNIGPLARRFSLSTQSKMASGNPVSLATLIDDLTSSNLDPMTTPAVTHSKMPDGANASLLYPTGEKHSVDTVLGSGSQLRVCCDSRSSDTQPVSRFLGTLSVFGDQGEFVSAGRSWTLKSPALEITLLQVAPGDLQFAFGHGKQEFDASFTTETGERFELREYAGARRWGDTDGHPGLEITGDSRGCNEIAGAFTVTNVEYMPDGKLARFAASFTQLCDGAKLPLKGSINVRAR